MPELRPVGGAAPNAAPKHPLEAAIDPKPLNVPLTLAGGAIMGVANIIPGVSGGTMILAMGLYEEFIESVASVTRLRRVMRPYLFLALLGVAALGSIGALAGVIKWAFQYHHVPTLATFIGLALGGVPIIWKRMDKIRAADAAGIVAGIGLMVLVTVVLQNGNLPVNWWVLTLAGMIASAAMVLPGISGSHLLLIMGLYAPIIEGIAAFKEAVKAVDFGAAWEPAIHIGVPVAVGIALGIALLSNLLEWLLERCHQGTMSFLLGLLIGSVIPLNPFRAPSGHKDLFEAAAPVTGGNIALVVVFFLVGLALTLGVGMLEKKNPKPADA